MYNSITMQALDPQKTFKHSPKPLREVSKDKGTAALSYLKCFDAQQQKTHPLPGGLRLQAALPPPWGPGWPHPGIWSQTPTLALPFARSHGARRCERKAQFVSAGVVRAASARGGHLAVATVSHLFPRCASEH